MLGLPLGCSGLGDCGGGGGGAGGVDITFPSASVTTVVVVTFPSVSVTTVVVVTFPSSSVTTVVVVTFPSASVTTVVVTPVSGSVVVSLVCPKAMLEEKTSIRKEAKMAEGKKRLFELQDGFGFIINCVNTISLLFS